MSTRPDRLPRVRQYVPIAVGAALIIVAMVALATLQLVSQPKPLQFAPTAHLETRATDTAPILGLPASSQGQSSTSVSSAVPVKVIDAYAAPDGLVLGPFDPAAERFTFVGRYGNDWAQIERADRTRIWLRRADLTLDQADIDILAAQPDLKEPTPAPRADFAPASSLGPPAPTNPPKESQTGQKPAADRAARHATAVARLQLPPPAR